MRRYLILLLACAIGATLAAPPAKARAYAYVACPSHNSRRPSDLFHTRPAEVEEKAGNLEERANFALIVSIKRVLGHPADRAARKWLARRDLENRARLQRGAFNSSRARGCPERFPS